MNTLYDLIKTKKVVNSNYIDKFALMDFIKQSNMRRFRETEEKKKRKNKTKSLKHLTNDLKKILNNMEK